MQPRITTSPGPGTPSYAAHASSYPHILPRPPQSPSPHQQITAPAPSQAPYQNQGYAVPPTPGPPSYEIRQPPSAPLHPAIRPQYGAPWPQDASAGQRNHHAWSTPSQTPGAAVPQPQPVAQVPAKPAFTKQSHSPIPLPPYVRQIAAASPSGSKQSPLSRPPSQAASPLPTQTSYTTTAPTQLSADGRAPAARPAPNTQVYQSTPQQGQWTPQGDGGISPSAQPRHSGLGVPSPSPAAQQPTQQQSPAGQNWATAPQFTQPFTPDDGQDQGTDNNSAALVEKMMMNLRRASQNFGRLADAPSQSEAQGQGQP